MILVVKSEQWTSLIFQTDTRSIWKGVLNSMTSTGNVTMNHFDRIQMVTLMQWLGLVWHVSQEAKSSAD